MVVPYSHESVRLTGRWDTSSPECAITVAPGSYLEFSFEGKHAVARFDIEANMLPLLHLWVQVDGGVNRETAAVCREAGADVAVAGTSVFKAANIEEEIRILRGEEA